LLACQFASLRTFNIKHSKFKIVFIVAAAIVVGLIWYAPKYLAYADQPVKSDVIVLFVGPDWNARKKEALKPIEEGYARHLRIHAYTLMCSLIPNPYPCNPEFMFRYALNGLLPLNP